MKINCILLFLFSSFLVMMPSQAAFAARSCHAYPCHLDDLIDRTDWKEVRKAILFAGTMDAGTVVNWSSVSTGHQGTVTALDSAAASGCARFKVTRQSVKQGASIVACRNERGDLTALTKVDGTKVPPIRELEKQAEEGDPQAQYDIARLYLRGTGISQSDRLAANWFRKAAEQKLPEAQGALGDMYRKGKGVAQDDRQAADWYRRAAEQMSPEAQFNLGILYERGQGVPQDYWQAAKWFRKAAEQGLAEAQAALGSMYLNGEAVPQDDRQAADWFRKAAEQGLAEAQTGLGLMYWNGKGVPQDYWQAAKWFRKAAEQGVAKAQAVLGLMYEEGRGLPRDDQQASYWYGKAAEQGLPEAQFMLGLNYYDGKGVPRDRQLAAEWWRKASDQGDTDAKQLLAELDRGGRRHKPTADEFLQAMQAQRALNQAAEKLACEDDIFGMAESTPECLGYVVQKKMIIDAEKQYEIVKLHGDPVDRCLQAQQVAAVYLQYTDEQNYKRWKTIAREDCARAGIE